MTVYRLVAKGTLEETILSLHADKRRLVGEVLDGTGTAAKLSTEELVSLIRRGGEDDAEAPRIPASLDASARPIAEGATEVRATKLLAPAKPPAAPSPTPSSPAPRPGRRAVPELLGGDLEALAELVGELDAFLTGEVAAGRYRESTATAYRRAVRRFFELVSAGDLALRGAEDEQAIVGRYQALAETGRLTPSAAKMGTSALRTLLELAAEAREA